MGEVSSLIFRVSSHDVEKMGEGLFYAVWEVVNNFLIRAKENE